MNTPKYPEWFEQSVIAGLAKLYSMNYPGMPSKENIVITREAWLETLWGNYNWGERRDTGRIQKAFSYLMAHSKRWPVPSEFFDALPPLPKTDEPPKTDQANSLIDGMQLSLKNGCTISPENRAKCLRDLETKISTDRLALQMYKIIMALPAKTPELEKSSPTLESPKNANI